LANPLVPSCADEEIPNALCREQFFLQSPHSE
jgi:hypothetical protein